MHEALLWEKIIRKHCTSWLHQEETQLAKYAFSDPRMENLTSRFCAVCYQVGKKNPKWMVDWVLFLLFSLFLTIHSAACIWFMHIRHRCRNSPRLNRGFFYFSSSRPHGLSVLMLPEALPREGIWNVATDKWTPHSSQILLSFVPSLFARTALLEAAPVGS